MIEQLADPPAEFGALPFWFWNDDLDEAELLRQLRAFKDGGCGGVLIHPRIGLSARVGYLTPEYLRLVRRVVEECAALGLRVILYDEASYPSGSACGRVVAENPDFAARGLLLQQRDVRGPWRGYWRLADGRSLISRPVCAVLARVEAGAIDPGSLRLLEVGERGLVRLEVGAGDWRVMGCLDAPSGGSIRGALPEQESGLATAPPAGDIMSPAAVAAFLRLTHDAYAAALGEHLGRTVVAMFTDEPSPLGRSARRGVQPYTAGLDRFLAGRLGWDLDQVHRWLPALWQDYGPQTAAFREGYEAAVEARIGEVFYAAQEEWCARHGIALTGHPHASNDMASLSRFHWPGQDAVWRWVLPPGSGSGTGADTEGENDSGLVGAHSVAARAATSAARAAGRRRIATELFGAYGWGLTLDEAKWLIDWHLARGNNLFIPHACFYSVQGGRAFESEPDLALHNCWWPHFQRLLAYVRRMSWLLTDCEQVCQVAVAGTGHRLPWEAARFLAQHQVDFLYVDAAALEGATLEDGRLRVGAQAYRALVLDGVPQPEGAAGERLAAFAAAGGLLLRAPFLAGEEALLLALAGEDLRLDTPAPDLRVLHVRKDGADVYALFNEGEHEVRTTLRVAAHGLSRWLDPLRLEWHVAGERAEGEDGALPVVLARRECRLLVVGDADVTLGGAWSPAPDGDRAGPEAELAELAVDGPWEVTDEAGQPVPAPAPGDWATVPVLERFSGTLRYATTVQLSGQMAALLAAGGWVEVDLGDVAEAAEVVVDGERAGGAMWAPYRVATPAARWRPGANRLEVRVTNSAANYYEGALRPSGLLGPVRLRLMA